MGVNANAGSIWKHQQVLWDGLICGQMLVSRESKDLAGLPVVWAAGGGRSTGFEGVKASESFLASANFIGVQVWKVSPKGYFQFWPWPSQKQLSWLLRKNRLSLVETTCLRCICFQGGTRLIQETGKVCHGTPGVWQGLQAWLGYPPKFQTVIFLWKAGWGKRGKYLNHRGNLFKTHISPLWTYRIRISDNEIENECGNTNDANTYAQPTPFLTVVETQFHSSCAIIQGEGEGRELDSHTKRQIMSTREGVYMYVINIISGKYLPIQTYVHQK